MAPRNHLPNGYTTKQDKHDVKSLGPTPDNIAAVCECLASDQLISPHSLVSVHFPLIS